MFRKPDLEAVFTNPQAPGDSLNRHPAKTILDWQEVYTRVRNLPTGPLYGVPRGGAIVAGLTGRAVDHPDLAETIVDDIVDSGATRDHWRDRCPGKPFVALVDKTRESGLGWVEFPWETLETPGEDAVVRLLEVMGEDPNREGLVDTPKRVIRSWKELTSGYDQDPAKILQADFSKGSYDQMILCRGIEFFSTCEHHLLPFEGLAHLAYLPGTQGRLVGLSKLARLVDCFARRLQIQERLTQQIAEALVTHLKPLGVGVMVEAKHLCMSCRGVRKHRADMVTTALLGNFRQPEVRGEFLGYL